MQFRIEGAVGGADDLRMLLRFFGNYLLRVSILILFAAVSFVPAPPTIAGVIPFAFWKQQGICSVTFSSNTTITSTAGYAGCDWTINNGVTVTIKLNTAININSLTMVSGSTLTHFACGTAGSACAGTVNLTVATDVFIDTGATINVTALGYLGGKQTGNSNGFPNTRGNVNMSGTRAGCHGGTDGPGITDECLTYDSVYAPTDFGTGGYGASSAMKGGTGGGVVRLNVAGNVTVNGTIVADGGPSGATSTSGGGGGGGSIWITCETFTSTSASAVLSAKGGSGNGTSAPSGGGGRIALYYNALGGTMAFDATHIVTSNAGYPYMAGSGTFLARQTAQTYGDLYIFGNGNSGYNSGHTYIGIHGNIGSFVSNTVLSYWTGRVATNWNFNSSELIGYPMVSNIGTLNPTVLTISANNATAGTNTVTIASGNLTTDTPAGADFALTNYQNTFDNVYVSNYASLYSYQLTVTGAMNVTGHSSLYVSKISAGSLSVSTSSNIQPLNADYYLSTADSVGVVSITTTGNLTIDSTSYISTDSMGYYGANEGWGQSTTQGTTYGYTATGGALEYSGGSHGGYGGYNSASPSNIPNPLSYDNPTNPVYGGSGGGSDATNYGGSGGGVVYLNIGGTLTVNGYISANGGAGSTNSGGGSGGSINITAGTITTTKSSGAILATGGAGSGTLSAGGGGGLVAITYGALGGTMAINNSLINVNGGAGISGAHGGSGILYAKMNSNAYSDIYFSNNNRLGNYLQTPFPQTGNANYNSINVLAGATAKQLSSVMSITSSATTVTGTNSTLYVPDNGTTGYGVWFVPGATTATGGGSIVEY